MNSHILFLKSWTYPICHIFMAKKKVGIKRVLWMNQGVTNRRMHSIYYIHRKIFLMEIFSPFWDIVRFAALTVGKKKLTQVNSSY